MKGIVIYKSTYGSTKEYANWIADETGFNAVDLKKFRVKDLNTYDTIILGSPIIAGRPSCTGFINKNWDILKNKKIILFSASGADGTEPVLLKSYEAAFPEEKRNVIKYFPLGGRMIMNKLNFLDGLLMKIGMSMEKDPKIKEEMGKDKDYVKRENIEPILELINS